MTVKKKARQLIIPSLGLDHLVGTPMLKPYMHGYFISLKLYDAARLISNPFAYAEHREKMIREKMDKMAETRIRSKKEAKVKVNKTLAEKILKEEEKARKREARKHKKAPAKEDESMDVDDNTNTAPGPGATSVLTDPRFAMVFENPEFAIDENSREFALLNPSAAAQRRNGARAKTAVEDEEEESDKFSSDGLGGSESDDEGEEGSSDDSSDAGGLYTRIDSARLLIRLFPSELTAFDPRNRPGQKNARAEEAYKRIREQNRMANVNLVPIHTNGVGAGDKNATFGQRRQGPSDSKKTSTDLTADGTTEVTWVPLAGAVDVEDRLIAGGQPPKKTKVKRPGVVSFAAGLERGEEDRLGDLGENERKGRAKRRQGVRSGSKNVFRRM